MKNVTNLWKFLEAIIKLTVITNISSIFCFIVRYSSKRSQLRLTRINHRIRSTQVVINEYLN